MRKMFRPLKSVTTMRANSEFTEENGIIRSRILDEIPFIRHGFTTRGGGVSGGVYKSCNLGLSTEDTWENVLLNYHRAAAKIGFDEKRLVLTRQVHSTNVKTVTQDDCGNRLFAESDILETDGLITNEINVPIGVFAADCTPILLCDRVKRVVAAVHSGWKGTLGEIAKNAAEKMKQEFSCKPKDIIAVIGPSIKKCHFEVKTDVYSLFCERFGADFIDSVTEKRGDGFYIDTDLINKQSLVCFGISEENIKMSPRCTFCEQDKFFSHRASGGKTGRQCAFIVII